MGNMRPPFGDLFDRFDDVALAVNGRNSAKVFGQRQFSRIKVYPDHICPRRSGDHHRRQADTTASMHGNPLTRAHLALVDHRAKRRGEPTSQTCCCGKVHGLGQGNHVQVGLMDRHVFRKAAPMGETGLLLMQAHLLMARVTFAA